MQQFNIPFCEEYSHSLEFKTSIIRRFDGSEQRQALWLNPKRSFSLNFEMTPTSKTFLEDFFSQHKGDCNPFLWSWNATSFGNGLDYKCFFDSSMLTQTVFPFAYSKGSQTLVSIDDGNILQDRFFLTDNIWLHTGNVVFSSENASYNGLSAIFQSGILTPGKKYRITVKTTNIQGVAPCLSSQTTALALSQRQFYSGEKTLNFVASGADLIFEMAANTSGSFSEISLFTSPENHDIFDFAYNIEHSSDIIFTTLKDEIFTWQNNRQNMAENPVRRWVLALELSPDNARLFEAFFIAKKGRYKAFSWFYFGEEILVRFDTDKLDQKQYPLGYREIKIPIIEVIR